MTPDTPLRGALVGCGFFAQNHLHAWRQIPGVRIVALCDTDPARLSASGDSFGIAPAHRWLDARAMMAGEALDFVDIATTAPSHRALVEMAAERGLHAICQKPFAPDMADARAMVQACEAAKVQLMVHENFRWQTPIQALRHALESGAIGKPHFARLSFRSAFDVYQAQPYLAEGSRFIVEDLGIHIIDVARCLLGDVSHLSAVLQRVNPRIQGEDVATLLMVHEGGATSVVDCSYASHQPQENFPQTLAEIDGDEGTLRLHAGYRLVVHRRGGTTRELTCEPPLHTWAQRPWFNIQDSVLNIQAHWVQCLREGREPQTSGRDNLKTLALVEQAYRSASRPGAMPA